MNILRKVWTLFFIGKLGISHEHPHSMAVHDVIDIHKQPPSGWGYYSFKIKECIARSVFLKVNVLGAV